MATFQAQIEGLTSISTGTTPTTAELTTFLTDGAKDLINKLINIRPDEAFKFATETGVSNGNGTSVLGKLLSVVRENNSSTDVRSATPIPANLRFLVTDIESIYYRSKFNPCYYLLNGKIFVLPAPTDSDNQALVSQINYPAVAYGENSIDNFPDEYEYLVVLYASALTCQVTAAEIQNNMPTVPTAPNTPSFESEDVALPVTPLYIPPPIKFSFSGVNSAIGREDIELIDKSLEKLSKELEIHKLEVEESDKIYQEELKVFDANLQNSTKNVDRNLQKEVGEYRSEIYKFQYEVSNYSQELTSKLAKYKWYMEQYIRLMNQYASGIMNLAKPQEASKENVKVRAPRERAERREDEEYGG